MILFGLPENATRLVTTRHVGRNIRISLVEAGTQPWQASPALEQGL